MAMDTVQKYVDIPIDHYVSINMKGLKELVDAVGGIEVNNDLTFSQDGYDFPIGKITLNGIRHYLILVCVMKTQMVITVDKGAKERS